MNEHGIEELIGTLYEMVQDAKSVPFSSDRCALERERVLDLLDEISNRLPGELKQAKTIVESRSELITSAKREAEGILKQAQAQARQLVSQEAVYAEAKSQANEMVRAAQDKIKELKQVTNDYVDDSLRRTEEAVAESLAEIRESRSVRWSIRSSVRHPIPARSSRTSERITRKIPTPAKKYFEGASPLWIIWNAMSFGAHTRL